MATIKDIAKIAGVSVTTVSRALNGYSDVSEKTRSRVEQVAKELKYSPNAVARTLVMNKSKTIGLLVSDLNRAGAKDMFTYEVMCGINDSVSDEDYDLILFSTNHDKQQVKTYTQLCQERQVEGVIMQGVRMNDTYLTEIMDSQIPCVLIDVELEGDSVGYVSTDNVFGAQMAVKHLVNLGHKKIGFINGHDQALVSKKRREGYEKELTSAGITIDESLIANGEFNELQAEIVARDILTKHQDITAFFCASDLMALGAMRAIQQKGLRIPEDISIVGFDDITLAQYTSPPLTTVSQDKYQMGYVAAKLLIGMLTNSDQARKTILDNQLIKRGSTAPVKR
ncbi:LacI family DNA-binding transcriptional regulator [Paenalkalicoccus suaedae]|uniref:LacI family DNA-binding transcriptional regulator n=1 Tax=Paenalkalicoccus suaedae TaxID=2592382 RepID=A0A859FBL4_9BACI|nr:LacI family DNA-binding transcriptional regulator [Paenalkalicoccus suaedae]QKS70659.1 LacI family DNA-binding transcriptional regulator [Paenalkalicoccus suaedae]